MPKPIEKALAEARNPQTESDRLEQLSQWKRGNERSRLRQAIATNPNCEEWLLLKLVAEYPKEVINNPRLQLLQLSEESWWEDCEPFSLLMLLVELGSNAALQMRRDFFNQLGGQLTSTDALAMNYEWHMGFNYVITIGWNPDSTEIVSNEDHEQEFSMQFSCVVEENLYFLKPPGALDDPLSCIEALIKVNSREDLLDVLKMHGWEEESDSCPGGQGYWKIESVTPDLENWELEAHLGGDGSGTIQVTDPSGRTHDVEIEAPDDYGDEYLNPTLDGYTDFIANIFHDIDKSPAEMRDLLLKVIANEKQSKIKQSSRSDPN